VFAAGLELFLAYCRVSLAQTAWREAEESFEPLLREAVEKRSGGG
jgi:hypothetical protein